MSEYAIYSINIFKSDEQVFGEAKMSPEDALKISNHVLEEIFTLRDEYNVPNDDQAKDPYPMFVAQKRDGVIVLEVRNVQKKKIVKHDEENSTVGNPVYFDGKEKSYPLCYVVVDARIKGECQVAIERSSAFRSNTDIVRNILQTFLHTQLFLYYGLDASLPSKMKVSDIHEFIEDRVVNKGDRVERISYEFMNANLSDKEYKSEFHQVTQLFLDAQKAVSGIFNLKLDDNSYLNETDRKKRRKVDQVAQAVALCGTYGYELTMFFKKHGKYICNENIKAYFDMPESDITDFINGQTSTYADVKFAITKWLDEVRRRIIDEGFKDETEFNGN